nr:MAG TPA_asm: hypothetical protein [Caudoviricetes sp.]
MDAGQLLHRRNIGGVCARLRLEVLCRFHFCEHAATDLPLFAAGGYAARLPCGAVQGTLRDDV